MEPKDLKNSEELKSTENSDPKNVEDDKASTEEKVVEETVDSGNQPEQPATSEKVVEQKTETTEEKVAEIQEKDEKVLEVTETVEESTEAEKPAGDELIEDESVEDKSVETTTKEDIELVKAVETAEIKEKSESEGSSEKIKSEITDKKDPDKTEEKEKVEESSESVVKDKKNVESPNVKEEKAIPEKRQKKREKIDYSGFTQIELVNSLRDLLDNVNDNDVKEEVDVIKSVFYKNKNEAIEAEKKAFLEGGGNIEEFNAEEDPYEKDIKDLLNKYRHIRIEFNKKLEVIKEENLKLKYQVIEDIKGLINNEESINKTFNDFRDLQWKWREIGLVPQSKMKNLWDTYHFHVENFYNYIKINKELRDLDLRKNLEMKINLCERAEELLVESSIIKAFNTLQKYHEQWREIGPVPMENKDDIWERFKAATSKINKKHQEFFENRKLDQKKNLDAKTALCEKVEEIITGEITNHKEWDEKSKQLVELQKVWRTIGFAPRKDNNKIYERFRTACDKFFDEKREFYNKNKELQQNNLQLKIDLCIEAEALKDNTDWKKTTQDFINIQRKWKEIGPVPRKHSDSVWKRFRAACDYFFDKKSDHFSHIDTEQVDNLKRKESLIEEVIGFKPSEDVSENLKILKSFQRRWTDIGHVPIKKKDEVQIQFREAINKLFDDLNLDEEKRNLLKFRSKMNSFSESNRGQNKMRMEREKYMSKLKQLENDLTLLDNNIGFFAKSKNAESLIEDVKQKIENTRQKIELLKEKIRVIDDVDKSE